CSRPQAAKARWHKPKVTEIADHETAVVRPPRTASEAKQSGERRPDNQGCNEDHRSQYAKAFEAGHWTVTSKRKGPPRASGTHTRRDRRLSSITREPWRKVMVPWASAGTRPRRSPSRLEGPRHQPSAL